MGIAVSPFDSCATFSATASFQPCEDAAASSFERCPSRGGQLRGWAERWWARLQQFLRLLLACFSVTCSLNVLARRTHDGTLWHQLPEKLGGLLSGTDESSTAYALCSSGHCFEALLGQFEAPEHPRRGHACMPGWLRARRNAARASLVVLMPRWLGPAVPLPLPLPKQAGHHWGTLSHHSRAGTCYSAWGGCPSSENHRVW